MIDVSMLNTMQVTDQRLQKEECDLDEKELLRQLQKQRAGALEQAVAQYGAYVLAIIRNRSRGVLTPEDHEEIASDVFFALWNGAARIERGQLRPWLGAVARNRTAEAMRKQNIYLPLEDDTLITLDRLWEQMLEKERCAAITQAMRALPDEDREIFYRFYDLSQTAAQIAEDLHLNASTVRSRLMRGRRILSKTMGKIKETKRKPARPVRTVLIAAAIAALLCGSAFAAHSFGWFDRLFGEKAALVKDHVTSYDETTTTDITQPTYTEEEQAMIAEGTMQVPDTADLADTGVSAETDDFTFTLESMLVSRNSFYAIMRIDAKNDDAAAELAAIPETDGYQKELARMLWVGAHNNTNFGGFGADHRLEWKNGGMSMEIMQVEGSTAYALLTNIGGEFEPGDRILFDMSHHDQNVDLFEIPVPEQLEQELVIELDGESGPDDRFCWQTATISPISFQLDGIYGSGETSNEAVSITLKDGISFALSSAENGYEASPYGTYGSWGSSYAGSWESNEVKNTWLFSQIIDLDELASVTVCGVTYPVLQ